MGRTLSYVLLLVTIIACGWYLKNNGHILHKRQAAESLEAKRSDWENILPGTWKIIERYTGTGEKWELESILEIDNRHNFQLNGEEKYFDSDRIFVVSGGGAIGTWESSDRVFYLHVKTCNFRTTKDPYNNSEKLQLLKCDIPDPILYYGKLSSTDLRSQIEELTNDRIFISGTNYSGGYKFTQEFTRLN